MPDHSPAATTAETLSFTCWCGVESTWRVSGAPEARQFTVVSHESSFVCVHWRDVHDAISDLADGLDPAERCPDGCLSNPCIGGNGPMSCESLPADDPRWTEFERESEAAGELFDVIVDDVVRRQAP